MTTGRLTGFNVDLARAICAELDIRCTIQARAWDDLVDHLFDEIGRRRHRRHRHHGREPQCARLLRRLPALAGAFRRAPRRCRPGDDAGGTKGKTLAVVARTAHEAYLAAMFPEVERKLYPTADAARQAVKDGEADAHFGDGLQLSFWLESRVGRPAAARSPAGRISSSASSARATPSRSPGRGAT